MLVMVDGVTGKLITSDGRSAIMEDPEGAEFPWKPEPIDKLLTGEGLRGTEKIDLGEALKGKVCALYFSAHWVGSSNNMFASRCVVLNVCFTV